MPWFIPINPALQRLNDAGKMIVRRAARYKEKRSVLVVCSCCSSDRTKQRQTASGRARLRPHVGHTVFRYTLHKADRPLQFPITSCKLETDFQIEAPFRQPRASEDLYYESKLAFQRQLDCGKVIVNIKASSWKFRLQLVGSEWHLN